MLAHGVQFLDLSKMETDDQPAPSSATAQQESTEPSTSNGVEKMDVSDAVESLPLSEEAAVSFQDLEKRVDAFINNSYKDLDLTVDQLESILECKLNRPEHLL